MTYFYPRPPRGGRQGHAVGAVRRTKRFLSTPSARRATLGGRANVIAGDDGISIHALREEGDGVNTGAAAPVPQFLSTPSARRATQFDNYSQ